MLPPETPLEKASREAMEAMAKASRTAKDAMAKATVEDELDFEEVPPPLTRKRISKDIFKEEDNDDEFEPTYTETIYRKTSLGAMSSDEKEEENNDEIEHSSAPILERSASIALSIAPETADSLAARFNAIKARYEKSLISSLVDSTATFQPKDPNNPEHIKNAVKASSSLLKNEPGIADIVAADEEQARQMLQLIEDANKTGQKISIGSIKINGADVKADFQKEIRAITIAAIPKIITSSEPETLIPRSPRSPRPGGSFGEE
jgi:hypothetical protein